MVSKKITGYNVSGRTVKGKGIGIARGEGNKACQFPLLLMVAVPIIPIIPSVGNWSWSGCRSWDFIV